MRLHADFFAAAAQLIPVLLVAAAVDTRAWAGKDQIRPSEVTGELVALVSLTAAWVTSLFVLGTERNGAIAGALVALGLAVGWVQVASSIGIHLMERQGHAKVTRRQRSWFAVLIFMPIGIALALGLTTVL